MQVGKKVWEKHSDKKMMSEVTLFGLMPFIKVMNGMLLDF